MYYLLLGALALALASLPYLYGALNTPPGHVYSGLTHNIDDAAVYLTWIRQASEGVFFQFNRFTTEPQKGIVFNLFFLLLGNIAKLTGLAPIAVYHGARLVFGALLLWAVAALVRRALADERGARAAYALACFSAGLGWLTGGFDPGRAFNQPIDLWQPEAITFLSLYFAPLFTAALALMAVFANAFLKAERSGRARDLWPALVAGLLLGNFHSYDVIQLFALALGYRLVADLGRRRKPDPAGWLRLALLGLAMLPTTAYTYYALRFEPVFAARAFASFTHSAALPWVLLGYGLVLLLAVAGAALPTARAKFSGADALRLALVWGIVALAVAYVPVSFQRKLLMGAHLPLCLLAGAAVAALTERLTGSLPKIAAFFLVLLTVPSNALFLLTDVSRLQANVGSTHLRPYLTDGELDALRWLRENTKRADVVLVSPDPASHLRFPGFPLMPYLSTYVPAIAGNVIYNGHWSETAAYEKEKLPRGRQFFRADTPDAARLALLRDANIRYVLYANALADGPPRTPQGEIIPNPQTGGPLFEPAPWPVTTPPPYLREVHRNADVTIYEVTDGG
ncbi:MAG TPA: hypothetical protein VM490_11995 [Armatimonadaceae bacterium]|nr:hypothetical protein [Armatimonadaceae bacterium]